MADEEQQVQWNLSGQISDQIGALIHSASRTFINGMIINCYFYMKEIKVLINHHLTPEELKEVKGIETLVAKYHKDYSELMKSFEDENYEDSDDEGIKKKIKLSKTKRDFFVLRYRELIIRLLDSYGYLMQRKKDSRRVF